MIDAALALCASNIKVRSRIFLTSQPAVPPPACDPHRMDGAGLNLVPGTIAILTEAHMP